MDQTEVEYLRVAEVARMLGVTPRWVYQRIWDGELTASKTGKLYFVRRADVKALLDFPPTAEIPRKMSTQTEKCGRCLKLVSVDKLVDICEQEGCKLSLCSECWEKGFRTCRTHLPTREEALKRAQAEGADVLLQASDARLREVNFLQRIQAGIANVNTLVHPQTEEIFIVNDWKPLETTHDHRRELMQLLGRFTLTKDTTDYIPLNASARYTVYPKKEQTGKAIIIDVQVLSHLPAMVQQGFDTQPFGKPELTEHLLKYAQTAANAQETYLVLLAATTGWDETARQIILGNQKEAAFVHNYARFYLYDMETNELLYNQQDRLSRGYADLFSPLLPEEQLKTVIEALENRLKTWMYEHITLAEAQQFFPEYSAKLLRAAFERLAATKHYTLDEEIAESVTLIQQ
jgi:excisionase family DNA binding protein